MALTTDLKLTEWTACGGCAAKWGAAPLNALVRELAATAGDLIVGLAPYDDAAVYRLSDDQALVATTDFFPPLVDDPADFGAVAAANACSDVFAMGGRVVLALNISAFPERLPVEAVAAILGAAGEVVAQAGGVVAGGHTIRSEEPIFGLAVQGLVHPDRVWTKAGARPGDALVLSKPIGTGILLAGGSPADKAMAVAAMRSLNRAAAEALSALGEGAAHAVTDVTGFGLLGHAWEMAERSGARLRLDGSALPLYGGALAAAEGGTRTGGDARNRAHLEGRVSSSVTPAIEALAYDPQTSGGLLAAVSPADARRLAAEAGFWVVGEVAPGAPAVELA
ncbi:MAG: selenide, water dikinase SelD [Actinomycetota bacterium]|nr:selenide, water dikinase SelD [Actinomycetota bacterium]